MARPLFLTIAATAVLSAAALKASAQKKNDAREIFGKALYAAQTRDGGTVTVTPVGNDLNRDDTLQDNERTGYNLQINKSQNTVMLQSFDKKDSTYKIKSARLFDGEPKDDGDLKSRKRYTGESVLTSFTETARMVQQNGAGVFIARFMMFANDVFDKKNDFDKFLPGLKLVK